MNYESHVKLLLTDNSLLHLIAGLASECGEVCGVVQKSIYKHQELNRADMSSELGDVLFYVTALINHFGWTVDEIQKYNIEKLRIRNDN